MSTPLADSPGSSLDVGADFKRVITTVHTRLDDFIEREVSGLGISIGEADVLTVVLIADDGPAPSLLADWLSLTTAGMTGRLNSLDRKGLIERRPDPSDGRRLTVHLTATGSDMAAKVLQAKDRSLTALLKKNVGMKRTRELIAELDEVVDVLLQELGLRRN